MIKKAVFTVISTNYLAHARVLAKSFLKNHKGFEFYVVFVDEGYEEYLSKNDEFIAISYKDIGLIEPELMGYQYSLLEFATAVKPTVFKHLFKSYGYRDVIFLDPDILVLNELSEILSLLETKSILLTPHTFSPIEGKETTSEECLLKAGIYNLGFIALSYNEEVQSFLDWWTSKLEFKCKVDVENGIFVDQKWIDLVPNYFEGCFILKNREFNIAKWNLHERQITYNKEFLVNQKPIGFFHFSGYSPLKPNRLSINSERYANLNDYPDLKLLCDEYSKNLLDNDFYEVREKENVFIKLSNGVYITDEIREVIRYTRMNGIRIPNLKLNPDLFCAFIFCVNPQIFGSLIPPFIEILLRRRPDVRYHYSNDKGVVDLKQVYNWLKRSCHEEPRYKLLEPYFEYMFTPDAYTLCNNIYKELYKESFPNLYTDNQTKNEFLFQLKLDSEKSYNIPKEILDEYKKSLMFGSIKCLNAILENVNELENKLSLGDISDKNSILHWFITTGARNYNLKLSDILAFEDFMRESKDKIFLQLISYSKNIQKKYFDCLGFLDFSDFFTENLNSDEIISLEEKLFCSIPALNQLEYIYTNNIDLQKKFPKPFESIKELAKHIITKTSYRKREEAWKNKLTIEANNYKQLTGYNLYANHAFKGGMGELTRSLHLSLEHAGLGVNSINIPTANDRLESNYDYNKPIYGMVNANYRENLIVVNASATNVILERYISKSNLKNRKNIAYWTWESENITPEIISASNAIDEVWVPSNYNKEILSAVLDIPIHVIPLIPDIELDSHNYFNKLSEVPNDYTTFGFFFDANSFMERKNPKAVIDSFRIAFSRDDKAILVLKVFNVNRHWQKYLELKRYADDLPILWIEDELSKGQLTSLMNNIDVYVSLHRSEAFGFTMAEAMKLEKPVIATAYSGNMDFMDRESSCLVNYKKIVTTKDYGPYLEGAIWAEPDVAHAAYFMRELHLKKDLREAIGIKAKQKVENVLSSQNIIKAINKARNLTDNSKEESFSLDYKVRDVNNYLENIKEQISNL